MRLMSKAMTERFSAAFVAIAIASSAAVADATSFRDDAMLDTARRAAHGPATRPLDVTVNIGRTPEEQKKLEDRRDAELNALIAKLKQSEATRKSKAVAADTPQIAPWSTEVIAARPDRSDFGQRSTLGARPDERDMSGDDAYTRGRATVLLVMHRPHHNRRAADPILCLEYGCYISSGAQAPASMFNFSQALGPFGRIGRGAGACANSDICVFRGIDLGSAGTTMIQPVNLRDGRPDRRHLRDVVADQSCRMVGPALSCNRPIRTEAYTMWVVPERIAGRIGPEALERAAYAGLTTAAVDELPWQKR